MKKCCKKEQNVFLAGIFMGGITCGMIFTITKSQSQPKKKITKKPTPIGKEFKNFLQQIKEDDAMVCFETSSDEFTKA